MWQPYIPHCVSKLSHWLQTVRNSNKPKTHTFIWRFWSINRGAAVSTNHTHSRQRDLQHRKHSQGTNHHFCSDHLKRAPTSKKQAEEADGGEDAQRSTAALSS
ncbi:hypothetical protein AMELA_G00007090 [Ameiurus melas]|uniref:Uncharacterized protein n=1 Tax=Ameiurus melas TaxID=219545 RepID=A0A7J6BGB8_AMEME|nr:hypothetical protein AMELA_G00007090 [Ameiurus melas]